MLSARYLVLLPLLLAAGCSSTVTNLTPLQAPRAASGLYPIEARWDSNQRSIRKETIKPYVVVGFDAYPMQPTPLTVNRWETLVPIPADQRFVSYHFKFDFQYDSIPQPRPDSVLSRTYQLELMEK